jgi:sialic acid synthase SpsE
VTSAVRIARGTTITADMLTYKRPGTGISAKHLALVVGRVARVDIPEDTTITWEMV